jgi:hypothetical protein
MESIVVSCPWALWKVWSLKKSGKEVFFTPSTIELASESLFLNEFEIELLKRKDLFPAHFKPLLSPHVMHFKIQNKNILLGRDVESNLLELLRKELIPQNLDILAGDTILSLAQEWVEWACRPSSEKRKKWSPQLSIELKQFIDGLKFDNPIHCIDDHRPMLDLYIAFQLISEVKIRYQLMKEDKWWVFFSLFSPWYRISRKQLMQFILQELSVYEIKADPKSRFTADYRSDYLTQNQSLKSSILYSNSDHLSPFSIDLENLSREGNVDIGMKGVWLHEWQRAQPGTGQIKSHDNKLKGSKTAGMGGRPHYILSQF